MNNVSNFLNLAIWLVALVIVASILLPQAFRILREYQRGVIFRLGKLLSAKGPGLIILIPWVDRMVRMDLRVITIDVDKQEVMTRDNVPATVDAEHIKANYEMGVLTLTLPKVEKAKPRQIAVEITTEKKLKG